MMRTVYDGYSKITSDKTIFFAGANTASGFVGDYDRIADEKKLERVYIIKGGPGTGKSTLMRRIAEKAESSGISAVRYLCGSDPESLDCVVLGGRIALLDGTAPHIREMNYPGASSEIIDVAGFLDADILEKEKEAIVHHAERKSGYYASAYEYLKAAERIEKDKRKLSESVFLGEKADAYITRLMKKLGKPKNAGGSVKYVRTHGLTMKGAYCTESFGAAYCYTAADHYGCAPLFMELLQKKLADAGYSLTVSKLPVPECTAEVFIEDCGVLIRAEGTGKEEKCMNLARFVADDRCAAIRGEYRLASKLQFSCIDTALERLKKAAEEHFALEQIYINAMDFKSLGKYTERVTEKVMKRLLHSKN